MRTFPVLIPAGVGASTDRLSVHGDFLFVLDSAAPFTLVFDDGQENQDTDRGMIFRRPRGFKTIKLINQSASAVAVKLSVSEPGENESIEDHRPMVRSEIAKRGVKLFTGVVAAGVRTLVETESNYRTELVIYAPATNVSQIYLTSEDAADRTIGWALPGQFYRLTYRGSVYVQGVTAGDEAHIWATYYI